MKVLLYAEASRFIRVSGIGCAVSHQKDALTRNGIEYTTNPRDSFDVAHINTCGPASRRLAKRLKKAGTPVVYHAHSTEEDFRNSFIGSNFFSKVFKRFITSCYNLGDVIVTPTNYSKRLIEGYGIIPPVKAVSNGIDASFYQGSENDRSEFRKRFGYKDSDKVIMSVGLFIERKGILDFVELARRMPNYKFIWFGKTPLYSVPSNVRKAVRTKLPNLTFAGFVEAAELKKAYHGADLFAFLTQEETEGIVLLEALASKIPVLVRDITIYRDFITEGVTGFKAATLKQMERKIIQITTKKLPDTTQAGYLLLKNKGIDEIGRILFKVYSSLSLKSSTALEDKSKSKYGTNGNDNYNDKKKLDSVYTS